MIILVSGEAKRGALELKAVDTLVSRILAADESKAVRTNCLQALGQLADDPNGREYIQSKVLPELLQQRSDLSEDALMAQTLEFALERIQWKP
jgi:hypothetical protein